ncbi:MAG: glycosyltransferase family A protein [Cyanobacteria bacterium P01_E01_bin.48]
MSAPLVSVVIPMYGVAATIAAAVDSVLAQTYQRLEVIAVDDGSPDDSATVCEQCSDPRLRVVRQTNRGLAGARNTGIRVSRGDYIGFLDGDDMWLPDKIARHVEHLERSPQVGVSFSRSELMEADGTRLGTYLNPRLTDINVAYLLRENPVGNGSAAIVRRETLSAIAFVGDRSGEPVTETENWYFDETFRRAEDQECWLRIALLTDWQIEGLAAPLTLYRINRGGLSANLHRQLESWEQMVTKLRALSPELIAPHERRARAYILRYLARNAIRMGSKDAAAFARKALTTDWRIAIEEPRRTSLTVLAAHAASCWSPTWWQRSPRRE